MDRNMDERQLVTRGRIFKHTTFVLIGLLLTESLLQNFFEIQFFDGVWSKLVIMLAAVTSMSAEMVWRDAYPLSGKRQLFLFSFLGLAGLACLVISVIEFSVNGEPFTAGKALSESAALLFMAALFAASGAVYLAKRIKDKRSKEE